AILDPAPETSPNRTNRRYRGSKSAPVARLARSEPFPAAHTPATPGLNAQPGAAGVRPEGPVGAFAGASGRAHAASGARNAAPQGDCRAHRFFGDRAPGVRGFVEVGRESPASRVGAHTPRRPDQPRRTPHFLRFSEHVGVAPTRVARRPGRAKIPT